MRERALQADLALVAPLDLVPYSFPSTMAQPARKTIVVCGAVVDALLRRGAQQFAVRALVRNTTSAKAEALARQGVEVVAANYDEPESLQKAFAGAYGAFCITNYWQVNVGPRPSHRRCMFADAVSHRESMDAAREAAQAAALASACKAAGVQHAVWSTLEDTRAFAEPGSRMPALGPHGEYSVPHFDEKGAADERFRDAGVPTTFLRTSFFFENFLPGAFGLEPKRKAAGGPLVLSLPMAGAKLSCIAVRDIGACAAGCFLVRDGTVDKTVGIAGDHLTGAELASVFSKVLRKEVLYEAADLQAYRASGGPGAEDMANMFQIYIDFEGQFTAARDLSVARKLDPELQSFEAWLTAHADAFKDL
jgi:uncharacterized protein YbjT (DUF2867 family)